MAKKLLHTALSISIIIPHQAFAAPDGNALPANPQLTVGTADISSANNTLTIQQYSAKAAINWDSFSVGENAKVEFKQPDANSIALNRVVGNEPSVINGTIEANGQVFILNSNGVLTGKNARINAAGVVLGAAALSDADFSAGTINLTRTGGNGEVINQGEITAKDGGYVVLAGKRVSNQGMIAARMGTVALAAGDKVRLNFAGAALLSVTVEKAALDAYVENKQAIYADGGVVLLTARAANALLATVVNNDGVIEATSLSNKNGVIRLEGSSDDGTGVTQISGTLNAAGKLAGETGGEIAVLGDNVAIKETAVLNASGNTGGGRIYVGGDYQGNNPDAYKNAKNTDIAKNATLSADATQKGNGGRVIVWADNATSYRGTTSVRGGVSGGDGGFIEVSGKKTLLYAGSVDTTAPQGNTGLLLLDPDDIVIKNGSGTATPNILFETDLEAITATTNISVLATNSITIESLTSDGILNLAQTAGRSVTFSAGAGGFTMANTANTIQTAGGALNITTTGGTSTIGRLATAGGLITLNIGGTATAAGIISGTNTALTKTGSGTLTLSGLNTYTGATTINAGILSVGTLANGAAASGIGQSANTAGNLVLGGGTLHYTGATVATNRAFTLTAGTTSTLYVSSGAATLTISGAAANTTGALIKAGSGGLTLSGTNLYTGLTTISAGTLTLGANNVLSSGAITINGGTLDINTRTDTVGAVTLISGTITGSTGVLSGTSYAVESGTINGILGGAVALTKTTAGTVTLSKANTYTGLTTVSAGTLQYG
ncbi:MAG: filamentous hemagglutinin N-terminal domain-containing protein, partial [Holosporales bacterium]